MSNIGKLTKVHTALLSIPRKSQDINNAIEIIDELLHVELKKKSKATAKRAKAAKKKQPPEKFSWEWWMGT